MKMNRLAAALSLVIIALASSAWVIKDTASPVEIYTGSNTSPTISAATSGAVTTGIPSAISNGFHLFQGAGIALDFTGGTTDRGIGANAFYDTARNFNRSYTARNGAAIIFGANSSASSTALTFYANQAGDSASTQADLVGSISGNGAWTVGPVGGGVTHGVNGALTISDLTTGTIQQSSWVPTVGGACTTASITYARYLKVANFVSYTFRLTCTTVAAQGLTLSLPFPIASGHDGKFLYKAIIAGTHTSTAGQYATGTSTTAAFFYASLNENSFSASQAIEVAYSGSYVTP